MLLKNNMIFKAPCEARDTLRILTDYLEKSIQQRFSHEHLYSGSRIYLAISLFYILHFVFPP